jgi:hypothetical protein
MGVRKFFTQEFKVGRGLEQIFCHKKHRKETILGQMWVRVGVDRIFLILPSSADFPNLYLAIKKSWLSKIENCNKTIVDKLVT